MIENPSLCEFPGSNVTNFKTEEFLQDSKSEEIF